MAENKAICPACGVVYHVSSGTHRCVDQLVTETNEDWIREIVKRHTWDHDDDESLIQELATEVTSRLAEAYEEGATDGFVAGGIAAGRRDAEDPILGTVYKDAPRVELED